MISFGTFLVLSLCCHVLNSHSSGNQPGYITFPLSTFPYTLAYTLWEELTPQPAPLTPPHQLSQVSISLCWKSTKESSS